MGIVSEYLKLQQQYEQEHGERTVVLYQVGSFYEIYSYDPSHCSSIDARIDDKYVEWVVPIGNAEEISKILNCICTSKDSSKSHSIKNPYMAGFPTSAYEKNLNTLLANDYVVIRVDQEKVTVSDERGKNEKTSKDKFERKIADVCTPTTHADCIPHNVVNCYVMLVYIEYNDELSLATETASASVGVAVLDTLSGKSKACEFYSKSSDPTIYIRQLYSFILSHKPKEFILSVVNVPEKIEDKYLSYLNKELELERYDRVIRSVNKVPKKYNKISYQTECFNTLFARTTYSSTHSAEEEVGKKEVNSEKPRGLRPLQTRNANIIQNLGLDMMSYGRIAYILLMERCNTNCPGILAQMEPPDTKWIDESVRLVLTHNSLVQLDIIAVENTKYVKANKENVTIVSLLSLLDQNATNLGKRLLYSLIQSPMVSVDQIKMYYDMVDEVKDITVKTGKKKNKVAAPLYKILELKLRKLPDMDRLNRKLMTKKITPKELVILLKGYKKAGKIFDLLASSGASILRNNLLSNEDFAILETKIAFTKEKLENRSMSNCVIAKLYGDNVLEFSSNPFCDGAYSEIDKLFRKLGKSYDNLNNIMEHLNSCLAKGKLKTPEIDKGTTKKSGYQLKVLTTNAKAKELLLSSYEKSICGRLDTERHSASEIEIVSKKIKKVTDAIVETHCTLMSKLYWYYNDFIEKLIYESYVVNGSSFYTRVNDAIAKVDLIHNYAKLATKYSYNRPTIKDTGSSFANLTGLRHPIIERIITGQYISNDLSINESGILLYGHNRVGKSSLIKAVALCVVMAQAGCFVACGDMLYSPYNKIFTRMSSGDAILQCKSSFDIEMYELGMILKQSDNRSLVLGNELASSTETLSGTAISGSALLSFVRLKCSFLLASHAHNLVDLPQVKEIPANRLRICHLAVTKCADTRALIYSRKLIDGLGSRVYGVHVAESLMLEETFINTAYDIISYLLNQEKESKEGDEKERTCELVSTKTSKYSSDVYRTRCTLCGSTKSLNVHHIIHQKDASDKKLRNGLHVHSTDNLMVLCESCHQKTHKQNKKYIMLDTSDGKMLCERK
jgi:DNA mismatch repair protein MutS